MKFLTQIRRNVAVAALALSCLGAQSVGASTLSSVDWNNIGDGLLTLDSATGLQWLDWSVTSNKTMSAAIVSNPGFRGATAADFGLLLTDADLVLNTALVSQFAAASAFVGLFDTAGVTGFTSPSGGRWVDALFSDGVGFVSIGQVGYDSGLGTAGRSSAQFVSSFHDDRYGVMLVRETPHAIPEPASLALLGIAGVALGVSRRRRLGATGK